MSWTRNKNVVAVTPEEKQSLAGHRHRFEDATICL
jgi:hypothetical protein